MKIYSIEFHVDNVVLVSTQSHDTAWGAVLEAVRKKNDILTMLHCHTNEITFDDELPDYAPRNRDAVERFDYWMSDFALFQFDPNSIEGDEVTVCLLCQDVIRQTDPFIMEVSV